MAGAEGATQDEVRVRFVARPSSVPAMRGWLATALTEWGASDDRDDVLLAATELASNAMLHSGGQYFEAAVTVDDTVVRFVVEDRGTSPAGTIAHRHDLPSESPNDVRAEAATGRGLFLVSALASAWGIEEFDGGTRVWAEFHTGDDDYTPRTPSVRATQGRGQERGAKVIELLGCPPDLLLEHDANLADTARELLLFGATHGDRATVEAAEQVAEVVRLSAVYWDAARLVAQRALGDGVEEVDIATAPTEWEELPLNIAVLRNAVNMAERMMKDGLLMTLPAAQPVQEWRDWVEVEMVEQVTTGREPIRFADWRSRRP